MNSIENKMCSIYNSFTGTYERISLYYGLWEKIVIIQITKITKTTSYEKNGKKHSKYL